MVTSEKLGCAELLYRCAQQMGLRPTWVTPNGTFAVSIDGQEKYISLTQSPLNSHISAGLAKNKYLTRLILERYNMQNIPFSRPSSQADAKEFFQKYRKIIAKPLRGLGARDIHVVTQVAQLKPLQITDYILEKYIAGKEMRYLVLNGRVIAVHRSDYGTSVDQHRPLKRISFPMAAWNPELVSSSLEIARILDLKFAAVDYLVDATGHAYILEVNTTPGIKWFHAPTSGPVVDVAREFLESIFEDHKNITPVSSFALGIQPKIAYS